MPRTLIIVVAVAVTIGLLTLLAILVTSPGPATPPSQADATTSKPDDLRVSVATGDAEPPPADGDPDRHLLRPRPVTDPWQIDHGALRVRVVDEDGAPVPAVGLTIIPHDGRDPEVHGRALATDESGEALIQDLAAGDVKVILDRMRGDTVSIRADAITECVFTLPRGVTVTGQVVDGGDAPIAAAGVWVRRQTADAKSVQVTQTDAFGRFTLRCLVPRINYVGAAAPGLAPSDMQPVGPEKTQSIRIVLRHPAASVRGLVLDAEEQPVAGAVVRIGGRFGGPAQRIGGIQTLGWAPVTIRSGHDGCFTVDGLPTGQIEFLVHAPGHAPYTRHFDLLGHTRNEVTIRLCTGAALRGRVTDAAGGPIPGARITVGSFGYVLAVTTTSSASGRFDLRGLDPRRMRLTVSAAGFATFVGEYSARPGALLQIDVALVPEQIFRGRLLTPDTTPLPGWLVLLRGRSGGRLVTGEDGRFRGTIAQAKTSLRISPPDPRRFVECDWLGEVAVKGDELEIRVPSELLPSARVRGSLLQRDGQPAPRATVVLECDATPVQTLRVDITDGGFRLGPVTPGEYELRWSAESASGPTFGRRGLRLNAGELELGVLRIDGDDAIRAGWVDVQLQRSDGGRIESPSAYLYDHQGRGLGSIPLDGKAHGRQALPPGAYELSVLSDNSQWIRKRFSIEAGADAQLRLSLAPATRRYILFPWPIPAAWDKVTRVRYVIEDNRGTVLDADDLGAEDLPFMYMPGLQSGVHRLKLTTADGRRYAGTFAVEGLGKSSRPIVIGVELAQ